MKFLETTKDGGAESTVWAHWLIEIKGLFSVALLRFEDGTRDAFHSHAFNCVSWVLRGCLVEQHKHARPEKDRRLAEAYHAAQDPHGSSKRETRLEDAYRNWLDPNVDVHMPSLAPVITRRDTFHRVRSVGRTWVLTFRGPWSKTWREAVPDGAGGYAERTLTHGRREVSP